MRTVFKSDLLGWQNRVMLFLLATMLSTTAFGQQVEIFYEDKERESYSDFSYVPESAWIKTDSTVTVPPDATDWVKLIITPDLDYPESYFLRLGSGANMTIYSSTDSFQTAILSGPLFTAEEVNISSGNSWDNKILIDLPPDQTILYLKLDRVFNNNITIQPELKLLTISMEEKQVRNRFLWLFYGLMLFLLVYQIFFFLLLKDITYLVHAAFVCSLVGFLAYHEGSTYQHLFQSWPLFNYHLNFLLGLIPLLYGLFFRSYLKLYRISKKLDRWFRRTAKLHAAFFLIPIVVFWVTGSTAGVYTMVHVTNLVFISGYVWIFSKALDFRERQHQILMSGLATFALTGIVITTSYLAGAGLDWKIALECGVLIEGLIFSFALTYRTKVWENEKLESSHALVEQLRKNEELQNSFNQTLQEEVRIRTLQLKDALDKAEAGSRAKSEFLSAISHELRTPLNGIIGMTNLLKEDDQETKAELFQSLESSSEDLLRLVDNVLDYTALDSDNVQLHPEKFILADLLHQLSSTFEGEASSRSLSFTFSEIGKEIVLEADRDRLSQILINVLHNAFKFTSSGSVTFETEVEPGVNNAPGMVRFTISDTGIGMTEQEINLATNPFEQTQKGMQRGLQGIGIGLAIVNKLVGLMKGEFSIASEKGQGTSVRISLPLPSSFSEQEACTSHSGKESASNLEGKSVLLVEDHLVNQKVASKYLTKWGMQVTVAENGLVALNKVKESTFDLILMDLHMPVMDGFTAVRKIKALGLLQSEIPIIALSAATHLAEVQQEVMESGMLGFVTKPIKPVVLKERLQSCFHSSPS